MRRLLVLSSLVLAAACTAQGKGQAAREFDGKRALEYASTQVAFGPRVPGQPGHAAEARWIDSMSRARADTVITQHWWHRTVKGDSIEMTNIFARINLTNPRRVLYLAHWDTRPRTDNPKSKEKNGIMPGANDGASGVAILLGVMDALKKQRPDVGVDLLFVDGEDYGDFGPPETDVLIGAEYYAAHPIATQAPLFAILFDMVGAKENHLPVEENSQVAAAEVVNMVWSTAEEMGFGHVFTRASAGAIGDDHIPLIHSGIRTVDIINLQGYEWWHTKDDTIDKLSAESLGMVGDVAVVVIRRALK